MGEADVWLYVYILYGHYLVVLKVAVHQSSIKVSLMYYTMYILHLHSADCTMYDVHCTAVVHMVLLYLKDCMDVACLLLGVTKCLSSVSCMVLC